MPVNDVKNTVLERSMASLSGMTVMRWFKDRLFKCFQDPKVGKLLRWLSHRKEYIDELQKAPAGVLKTMGALFSAPNMTIPHGT